MSQQTTMRQWLDERQGREQVVIWARAQTAATTRLSGRQALAEAERSDYASELDDPVEEIELTELYRASGKIGHLGNTAHLGFVYFTDIPDEPTSERSGERA